MIRLTADLGLAVLIALPLALPALPGPRSADSPIAKPIPPQEITIAEALPQEPRYGRS